MCEGIVCIITHRNRGLFVKIHKFTQWPIQKEPEKDVKLERQGNRNNLQTQDGDVQAQHSMSILSAHQTDLGLKISLTIQVNTVLHEIK